MTKTKPSPRSPRRKPSPSETPLIRAVIFDLDDTLYDCFKQRVMKAHRHAAAAMVKAGVPASVDKVFRQRMKFFAENPLLYTIDQKVCAAYGIKDWERVHVPSSRAYFNLPVTKLTLYRGVRGLLTWLKRRGVRVFVVTFGEPATQKAKVRALGLERHPAIERIYYADRGQELTKEAAFATIAKRLKLPAKQVLIVGDRPSSEIRAGKKLGMHTVRVAAGEFKHLLPKGRAEQADHEIANVRELRELHFRFGTER